jgi:hypothetical protein
MRAYDIEMLKHPADRGGADCHGWVFGLPPGIAPAQWPLDPNNGFPLMHGFTLRLPQDYRVHGPDIVALSFLATAPDHDAAGRSRSPAPAKPWKQRATPIHGCIGCRTSSIATTP